MPLSTMSDICNVKEHRRHSHYTDNSNKKARRQNLSRCLEDGMGIGMRIATVAKQYIHKEKREREIESAAVVHYYQCLHRRCAKLLRVHR